MPQQISSYVLTPGGRPVREAEVEVGGRVLTKTDASGAFSITIPKPKRRTGITIKAAGFMTNTKVVGERSRSLPPVILAPVGNRVTLDGKRGGTLYFGGARLDVPANAFRTARGQAVAGPVRFEFTLLDVTNRTQLSAAMGDFTGRMLDGSTRNLRSFGIFQIRAYDRSGGSLELARERKIRFSIEVPERIRPTSPRQVGLFSFDRADGRWIQEGVAELSGGANGDPLVYNGSIDRIDWGWNLDDPTTITCVTELSTGSLCLKNAPDILGRDGRSAGR